MIALNNNWEFTPEWSESFLRWKDGKNEKVRIPHTVKMLPQHYINEKDYQMISGYRRRISVPKKAEGKRVFLQFDGAAHIATVYVNGIELQTHKGGYTAFRVEITNHVVPGEKCDVAVKLDSTENGTIPPFGFVIDYLTYGGIYRPVWLDIQEKDYISDIFVSTPSLNTVNVKTTIDGDENLEKTITIRKEDGTVLRAVKTKENDHTFSVENPDLWDVDHPNLYICEVELENGAVRSTRFGFRVIEFKADGFYLNGVRMVMRGLDRHQAYPYVGYAVSDSLQVEDARILKEELCCNAVRTSHYPQSQAFIDACDEMGLLVFTEIPGWQHVGDLEWKKVACQHVREMILQYRNHPSIVLWGVRINESQDDDKFYTATNQIAHQLDTTRPTSGVRYLEKSSLLEDVYAFNDFSHTGNNPGARKKKDITPDMKKSYLISEANGHMFPTKSFDKWSLRQEHALRHARVMNAALGSGEHAGVFQWCMFDYPTHKDFGSGDRVCYHGVMDAFRNPKLASSVYASQGDVNNVLEVGTSMDIGDYPGGNVGSFYVFTNADSVKLYKNDVFVKEFKNSEFKALKHGPLLIDDTIGKLLEANEGFTGDKEKLLHDCLLSAAKHGVNSMPLKDKAKMGYAMVKYKLKYSDGVELFGKSVGNWGGEATVWRFDGIKNGEVVVSRTLCPSSKLHLEVKNSSTELTDNDTYDMAAIRVRVLDEYDNIAPYAQLPIKFTAEGDIEVVGPDTATAEGGMTGSFVRTVGKAGKGKLTVSAQGLEPVVIEYTVKE